MNKRASDRQLPMNSSAMGFSFVENLVSMFIGVTVVVGATALVSKVTMNAIEGADRADAMHLAQKKVDDLKGFEVLLTQDGQFAYQDIITNEGGSIASGPVEDNNTRYQLAWEVDDLYYIDTDDDGEPDTWRETAEAAGADELTDISQQKAVTVTVSWSSVLGKQHTVVLDTVLSPMAVVDSERIHDDELDPALPEVLYTPGVAPEIIPITLSLADDLIKETSKPLPVVSQHDTSTLVDFDVITYNSANNTQIREDFLTVSCLCNLLSDGDGMTPTVEVWSDGKRQLKKGEMVNKARGQPVGGKFSDQPPICDQCCRDHHDTAQVDGEGNAYPRYDPQRPDDDYEADGDHKHYFEKTEGTFLRAVGSDKKQYHEVCRFQRLDGFYQLMPDWQLQDMTLMSSAYLVDVNNQDIYKSYVTSVVKALLLGQAKPSKPADRDIAAQPGASQLQTRGIYLDTMSDEHLNYVVGLINGGSPWLPHVPFYEINLTMLADWSASAPLVASVTSEEKQTIVDPLFDYYGTYSRGRLDVVGTSGYSDIMVDAKQGSSGVTGTEALDPDDFFNRQSDKIRVTIAAEDEEDDEVYYALTGEINCLNDKGNSCNKNEFNGINVFVSLPGVSCTITPGQGQQTPFYSCPDIAAGSSGLVIFSKSGYSFTPIIITIGSINASKVQNMLMVEQ